MDSEDEMHYYDSVDEDDYDEYDYDMEDDDELSQPSKNSFKVLNESDLKEHQEDDITSVAAVLSLSRAASTLVLLHHNWNLDSVKEAWFDNEDKVREAVGLLPASRLMVVESWNKSGEVKCRICLEACPSEKMKSAGCGHLFCCECWGSYIGISTADGPGCLMLRCPDPACRVAIDGDMVATFCSEEHQSKYSYYLRRSYIEASKDTKWCPAPGCEHAISYDGYDGNYDVCCPCKYAFCWNCTEEPHRPVDCKTVKQWILKNSSEAENTNWILANSKPCPKCQRPIEKNQGCMHMICTPPCKFHFCWLCLGPWSKHGERTGGYYACNSYQKAKKEGAYDEEERRREMAKSSLEKYTHYFERWQSNQSSRQKALEDLHQMQTVNMDKMRENQGIGEGVAQFLVKAWQQIVECRRVLKWTYAYGYYLPDHDTAKKQLFEYLQGEAESGLERLHQCAEKELQPFLEEDGPSKDFNDYQTKLAGLTAVTKNYFENLVRALENGLSDVESQQSSSAAKGRKKRNAETEIDKEAETEIGKDM
ncbi:putative aminoacyltransferase, E1 ubiquitin-activating enzyme [Rosa chinensis]|uniref:RBR-type E3 ubiquitin transferase n=1 Tax=Rosa chinensis TaxID=74649 RepID=A0A2P6QDM9_ROSCH|nr:probable E3 ubiquitin-protein ligase ARI8 [Rosa chinensis]PRQ32288.1 putative aminoacyltransferase, E1 ubiquitin-activating enzyme [Rosa chinensis]